MKTIDGHGSALPLPPGVTARVATSPAEVDAAAWNALLARQATPTPFMRHEYLAALTASGSADATSGWRCEWLLLHEHEALIAACPLYVKKHSWGEYVFDFAWANAYAEHGLKYYPKAVIAVPFTPVPGSRLLARDDAARTALLAAAIAHCRARRFSSLHVLFGDAADKAACDAAGLTAREQVQFHWQNRVPARCAAPPAAPPSERAPAAAARAQSSPERTDSRDGHGEPHRFSSFDDFLASLNQDKRKKIRQERRKVAEAGVRFRVAEGAAITPADWAFFYRCYERTYLEHGNAPYLTPAFFAAMARDMPEAWVMFIAEHEGTPIASSLIAVHAGGARSGGRKDDESAAYGRYWGALARVDSLHFEACYYQPIEWCIARGVARFEGGAQGEHKMARALMPVATHSSHWLAHPAFADAVQRFVEREGEGVARYREHLAGRSPFRRGDGGAGEGG